MPEGFEDWSGRRFINVDLSNTRWRETMLVNARFSGLITGLVVNDVEVAPLIDAELTRRHPERAKLRPAIAGDAREAWSVVEDLWRRTKARVDALDESQRHERVDDEWSAAETFRHLVFVTDIWISGNVLGRSGHVDPIALPPSFIVDHPGVDPDAAPTWAEIVAVREDRMGIVRALVDELQDPDLTRPCGASTMSDCLWTVLDEEWHHDWFANRDLDQLARSDR